MPLDFKEHPIGGLDFQEHPHEQPKEEGLGRQLVRGGLDSLPALGGLAGGAIATPETLGAATIPGAAAGYAAGSQLKRLGKKYLLGDKDDEIPSAPLDQAKQVAGDVGEGAVNEMLGMGAGKVLTGAGKAIADRLRSTGVTAAVRHLRPTASVARAYGPQGLKEVGKEALESGSIKPFQKVGDTAERLRDAADQVGAVKGDLVADSGAMVDPTALASRVQKNVIDPLETTTAGKRVSGAIRSRMDALSSDLGSAPVPASRIEAEKVAEQQGINYMAPKSSLEKGAEKGYASQLRQSVEDAMGNDPAFLAAKKSYGNLDAGADMASRTAGLADGGTGLMGHITDTGALMEGVHGVATGNPVQALTPVARAVTKGRIASTIAAGAYGAGNAASKATDALANPVARAISARTTPQALPHLQDEYIKQQTDPTTQESLKKSQE